MLHLIAKSSALVLVMWTTWWIIFVIGLLYTCICDINVVILFLMLTSEAIIAVEGDDNSKTISSSWWVWYLSSFFLLQILKEKQSEKLSIILCPEENSEWRGEKDGKLSLNLWSCQLNSPWWVISVIKLQLESVKCNGEDVCPIQELFLKRIDTTIWISKEFHTLDSGYWFVHVKVNMLMEC